MSGTSVIVRGEGWVIRSHLRLSRGQILPLAPIGRPYDDNISLKMAHIRRARSPPHTSFFFFFSNFQNFGEKKNIAVQYVRDMQGVGGPNFSAADLTTLARAIPSNSFSLD